MRRGVLVAGIAVGTLSLGLACLGGDAEDEPPEHFQGPTVESLAPFEMVVDPVLQRASPGATVTADLTVRWPTPDGGLPEAVQDFRATLVGTVDDGCQPSGAWVEEGVRYRFTLRAGEPSVVCEASLNLSYTSATRTQVTRSPSVHVQSVHTQVERLLLPVQEVRLGDGERRPMVALPVSPPYPGSSTLPERQYAAAPIRWVSTDPSVFEVDADGVMAARSTGTAELVVEAGGVQARVPVAVTDQPLGPPSLGTHPFARWNVQAPQGLGVEPADRFGTIDEAGWPTFVARHLPGGLIQGDRWNLRDGPLVVSRWTGTGYGFEALGEPGDRLLGGHPVVDPQGRLHLVVQDALQTGRALYSRDADTVSGGWVTTPLPFARELLGRSPETLGIVHAAGTSGALTSPPMPAHALSQDGTTFVALGGVDSRPESCSISVRVARIAEDGSVQVELVDQSELTGMSSCATLVRQSGIAAVELLPGPVGSRWPALVVQLSTGAAVTYTRDASGWRTVPVDGWTRSSPTVPPTDDELATLGLQDLDGELMLGEYRLPTDEFDRLRLAGDPSGPAWRSSQPRAATLAPGRHHHLALPVEDGPDAGAPTLAFTVPVRRTPQIWSDVHDGRVVRGVFFDPPLVDELTLASGDGTLHAAFRGSVARYLPGTLDGLTSQLYVVFRRPGERAQLFSHPSGVRGLRQFEGQVQLLDSDGEVLDSLPGQLLAASASAAGDVCMTLRQPDGTEVWVSAPADDSVLVAGTALGRNVSARPGGGAVLRARAGDDVSWTWLRADGTAEDTFTLPEDAGRGWLQELVVDGDERLVHVTIEDREVRLRRSEDRGRSWTSAPLPVSLETLHGWRLRVLADGRVLLAGSAVPTFEIDPRPVLLTTADGGASWSEPVWVAPESALGPLRDAVVTEDGTWVFSYPSVLTWLPAD